jgi:excisionase family DNA binding protein
MRRPYGSRSTNGGTSPVVGRKNIEQELERTNQILDRLWADTLRLLSEIRVANQKLSDLRALVGQPAEQHNHYTVVKDAPQASQAPVKASAAADVPLALTIKEASRLTSISRSGIYKLLAEGKITRVKVGSRTLIRREALLSLIEPLE